MPVNGPFDLNFWDEFVHGHYCEGTPDWDGGTSEGRLQNPSAALDYAGPGELDWLVGGFMRFYQAGRVRTLRILRAWKEPEDLTTHHVRVRVDGVAEPVSSASVALLLPPAL